MNDENSHLPIVRTSVSILMQGTLIMYFNLSSEKGAPWQIFAMQTEMALSSFVPEVRRQ